MPEGHTLHRLARDLDAAFAGRRARVSSPQGRFAEGAALLDGAVLLGAEAWGKQLFVELEGERFVHVHLGLIGSFDVRSGVAEVPEPIGQVRLRLATDTAYADLRGAIICGLVTEAERDAVVARSGPDPLREDADPDRAWQRIRRSGAPIGGLLLDQKVVAGIGNVYRAELLFRARMDPHRPGSAVPEDELRALWRDWVKLLRIGVETGQMLTIDGLRGARRAAALANRADRHWVYKREGLPCRRCGTSIALETMQGRKLYWCPGCQL